MKIQTSLINITPYYLYMQQVSDNMDAIRYRGTDAEFIPLQFAGFQGQVNTLQEQTVLEVTDFNGSEQTNRPIAPTLRPEGS